MVWKLRRNDTFVAMVKACGTFGKNSNNSNSSLARSSSGNECKCWRKEMDISESMKTKVSLPFALHERVKSVGQKLKSEGWSNTKSD
jgi:hypothetical protein